MSFFDDFANAVRDYPSLKVTLSIVDHAPVSPADLEVVNINEVWRFKVRVTNNGSLNLTAVSLCIEGQNETRVSISAAGPWNTSIVPPALASVQAHGIQDTVNYYFKAPNTPKPAGTALVRAHIETFNANLNHILNDHSGHADPPSGTYSDQVYP